MKLLVAAMVLASGVARADEASEPREKSEAVATAISLVGETASAFVFASGAMNNHAEPLTGVGVVGLVVAPSLGQLYAGEPGRAAISVGIRATAALGLAVGLANDTISGAGNGGALHDVAWWSSPLIYASAMVLAASTIYDLVDAHRAVRRERLPVSIAPTPMPNGAGMAIAGVF